MCRTVAVSKPLVCLEMGSFEDACTLRGYLTHRTTLDKSLVVGHFVSEATFKVAIPINGYALHRRLSRFRMTQWKDHPIPPLWRD